MNSARALSTALLLAVALAALPAPAAACSCARMSLCELFSPGSSEIVFEATVASIEMRELAAPPGADVPDEFRRIRAVHLKDIKNLLGQSQDLVLTDGGNSSCSIPFAPGQRYVIHAGHRNGVLTTGGCSYTSTLERSGELLDYLVSLSRPGPGATITGSVSSEIRGGNSAARGGPKPEHVTVRLEGQVERTAVPSATDGAFAFDRLPPGSYTLTVQNDGPWVPEYSAVESITLATAHSCWHTGFTLALDASIGGSVVDAKGRPVAGAQVYLRDANAVAEARRSKTSSFVFYDRATSDEQGRYLFESIAPGDYVAGLNISAGASTDSPYKPAYVTAVGDEPEIIVLPLGGHRLLSPLVAEPVAYVEVRGRVVWPDGRPAVGARVAAVGHGEMPDPVALCTLADTDAAGQFTMSLPSGFRHTLSTLVSGDQIDDKAEGRSEIVAGAGDVTLVLRKR